MKKITIAFTFSFLLSGPVLAQGSNNQALNICALAIPVFKEYVVSYEYLYARHHGLVARLEYGAMSDAAITATNQALVLNYRWHFSESMDSIFIGPYARYRDISGTGTAGGVAYNIAIPEWTVGLNIGKRWVWNNGFNVVLAAGSGASLRSEAATNTNTPAGAALATLRKDNHMFVDNSSYAEFSIGYVF